MAGNSSRFLELWDYEGTLNRQVSTEAGQPCVLAHWLLGATGRIVPSRSRPSQCCCCPFLQERHVILLAIRREVARRYKRMLLAGAKLDGGSKAWQQAFAQVRAALALNTWPVCPDVSQLADGFMSTGEHRINISLRHLQVMLAQQETVAALVQMLEEARLEAASVLRPLVRPASPQKLRALQSEQEANGRVKQDRWAAKRGGWQ